MPPLRRVTSCSPSARARTVTAHSLKAIGIRKGEKGGLNVRHPERRTKTPSRCSGYGHSRKARPKTQIVLLIRAFRWRFAGALTLGLRREATGEGQRRELDRNADVELRVGAAGLQVLVEQVLELEAADERVALDAPVGQVAAGDAGALAMRHAADAPAGQRARIEALAEHLGEIVEGQEARGIGGSGRIDEDADDPADLRAALPAAVGERRQPGPHDRLARVPRLRAALALRRATGPADERQTGQSLARGVSGG